jgi:hypothetical protein
MEIGTGNASLNQVEQPSFWDDGLGILAFSFTINYDLFAPVEL